MLRLKRVFQNDKYTIGNLYWDDMYLCDTLEPPVKVAHPCIPKGTYEIKYLYSGKFGCDMPTLMNVNGRLGILIHTGNTPDDTKGCILVGRNTMVGKVLRSKTTFYYLTSILKGFIFLNGCKLTITIE